MFGRIMLEKVKEYLGIVLTTLGVLSILIAWVTYFNGLAFRVDTLEKDIQIYKGQKAVLDQKLSSMEISLARIEVTLEEIRKDNAKK